MSDVFVTFGGDTGALEAAIAAVKAQMTALTREMKATATVFTKTGAAADSDLGQKLKSLGDKIAAAKDHLGGLQAGAKAAHRARGRRARAKPCPARSRDPRRTAGNRRGEHPRDSALLSSQARPRAGMPSRRLRATGDAFRHRKLGRDPRRSPHRTLRSRRSQLGFRTVFPTASRLISR
jgi:hypothetical protein